MDEYKKLFSALGKRSAEARKKKLGDKYSEYMSQIRKKGIKKAKNKGKLTK